MGSAGARLAAWPRRQRRLAAGCMVLVAVALAWAGFHVAESFRARSHIRAAQQALDRYDWPGARDHLQACLRLRPDDPATHLLAARAARRLEWLDEAEGQLAICERLEGGETLATRVERALLRLHRGELGGAEAFLRACVARNDPDVIEILDVLSAALILNYRMLEAAGCLDDLLQRRPDHFHALVRRGWTARSMSRYSEAVAYYEKALALRPDVDALRLALAEVQVALGCFTDARVHFEILRGRQPDHPPVLFGLARCLAADNDRAQAVRLLDRLLADHPEDWKALGERGWLSVQLDHLAEAEAYLLRAEALAPPDRPLLTHLADCLRLLGKLDESRAYQEKANRLQADQERGDRLGDLIRRSPNDPALRHELACILLRVGKPQDALHWFRTALERDPAHRPTHESLAAFYEQAGDFAQAAVHRRFLQPSAAH